MLVTMEVIDLIILDLVTDSSSVTTQQLQNFVNKKWEMKLWPENLYVMRTEGEKTETGTTLLRHLLEAKNKLDNDKKSDFILVTSMLLKKYWEKVCYNLFTPVHNWTVYGVPVEGQPLKEVVNVDDRDVEVNLKEILMGLESTEDVNILRSSTIPANIFNAGFSTRHGGISSQAPLASLNLVYTPLKVDPVAVIEENQRRLALAAGFDPAYIHCARVEHSNVVRIVDGSSCGPPSPNSKYDCLVTNTPGVTLVVPGADCCTILLADTRTGACGASHAGWKGTVKNAVLETLRTMKTEYGTEPVDIKAAIGPSVEMKCFSIPACDAKPISDMDSSLVCPVNDSDKKDWVYIDLARANAMMLERAGVLLENVDTSQASCTKCHGDLFFSNERGGFPFGSQVGFISCIKK